MNDTLKSLIEEILNDPPLNVCADDGVSCVFCGADCDYARACVGKPVVIHSPRCWLLRARKAITDAGT